MFSKLSLGPGLVLGAYMLGNGLWMAGAALLNLGMLGSDRFDTQFLPIGQHFFGGSPFAVIAARGLQGMGCVSEAATAAAMTVGAIDGRRRFGWLSLGTALQVLLFGGMLAVAFVTKGVGKVPPWTQYFPMLTSIVVAYLLAVVARRDAKS